MSSSSQGFRPEKFKPQPRFRDYVVYALMLAFLASLVGVPLYYFTRPTADKDKLRAKFGPLVGSTVEKPSGNSGGSPTTRPEARPTVAAPEPVPAAVAVSVYGGSKRSGVFRSDNPKLPEASPEFMQFAEALKISGAIQSNPAKAILNGKSFRVGETLDPTLGVIFAGLDAAKKNLFLRDSTGAELRVTY